MPSKFRPTSSISRRHFLKAAGATLGACGLACCGLGYAATQIPDVPEPETPNYQYGKDTNMEKHLLVAYATRTGSTIGVASVIGETLSGNGIQVDVRPVKEIAKLDGYDAFVLGSAINGAKWLPEAMQFLETHRAELNRKPLAAFLVCMTLAMKNGDYRQQVSNWLAPVRTMVHPVSEGLFPGVLDISKIPSFGDRLKFSMSVKMGVWSEGDHRDWKAIEIWAENIRPLLAR